MKTTMDLPEDLVTEIKIKAVRERRKMKDVAAEALRAGLGDDRSSNRETEKDRVRRRRLDALNRLGPVDEAQSKALDAYLIEYREDRETAFDRSER